MAQNALLFVGSINRATGYFATAEGEGISVFTFDEENGLATLQSVFKGIDNPTFIAVDRQQHLLFATSEVYGWNEGVVTALRFDAGTGALSYLNKQATLGSIAAHASTDHSGRYVLVTNYAHESKWAGFYGEDVPGQATTVFPIEERGWLGLPSLALRTRARVRIRPGRTSHIPIAQSSVQTIASSSSLISASTRW